jgi:uncharacterized repeat protein (TIGR03803 family)
VFKVAPNSDGTWTETVLYSFTGGADGASPFSSLIFDAQGNLYGTTISGGSGAGVVFKVDPTTRKETVLHSFTGGADGGVPYGSLIFDAQGNLYGTADNGGIGYGVVFKMSSKGKGKVTALHNFTGGDGFFPYDLVFDAKGNLYGSTGLGGPAPYQPHGVIYKLSSKRKYTILAYFSAAASGYTTGEAPSDNALILDAKGNLYGTLQGGGAPDQGVVFKLTP